MDAQMTARLQKAHPGLGLAAQLAGAALLLALLLTKTSASLAGNLPLALLGVVTVRWAFLKLERQQRARLRAARQEARGWRREGVGGEAPPPSPFGVPASAARPEAWRKFVRAPVVEEAWARFCGSIVQEFIYDMWWASFTPDREFPAEVRRLLNAAFGQLAMRARQADLRAVMNDLCELCMEQLELYRDTRESILLATQQPNCLRDMSTAARDRAFKAEMRAEGNLHPALQTPDGHYKFLRAVSEGVVAYLVDVEDVKRPTARVVCRELLAACVFRPLLGWAAPYYFNKALYSFLGAPQKKGSASREEVPEISPELASARSEALRGTWEHEQRLIQSARGEERAMAAARELRHQLRSKLSSHARSKSVDLLPAVHKGEAQQAQQQEGQQSGDAAASQQQQQQQQLSHKQAHLQARARSSSPADASSLGMEGSLSAARSMGSLTSGGSASQRGRGSLTSSQSLRPPRPPTLQQEDGAGVVAGGTPDSQQATTERGLARRPASSTESGGLLAEGWEAVEAADASDPSLAPARREFSMAHLLAPQADGAAVAGVTPRATSSSSAATSGSSVEAPAAFVGQARAKVVAADLNTSTSKDYVEFKIRVADDAGEWTVSRRYRNFEVLHRQLRAYAAYRLKLPPKRIFIHSNNVEFVEERRTGLDRYLQTLLAHEQLRHCPDLFEFLRAGSQLYELASMQPQPQQQQPLRRAPSSQKSEPPKQQQQQQQRRQQQQQQPAARPEQQQQRRQQQQQQPAARPEQQQQRRQQQQQPAARPERQQQQPQPAQAQRQQEVAADQRLEEQQEGQERGRQQRGVLGGLSRAVLESTQSMGRGLSSATGAVADLASAASGGVAKAANGVADAAGVVVGVLTAPLQGSDGTELRSGLTRRVRSVPTALNQAGREGSEMAVPVPRGHSGSALKGSGLLSKTSMRLRQAMQRERSAPQVQQLELSGHSGSSISTEGSEHSTAQQGAMAGPVAALLQRDSSGSLSGSPTKRASKLFSSLRRKSRSVSPSKEPRQRRERSPSRWSRRGDGSGSAAASRRNSGEHAAGDSPGMPPLLLSSLAPPSPLGANPPSPLLSFPVEPTLDPDDCAGISAPLFEIVDCLFQLQTRGYFRRQVFAVARQALSLVAGEAIDSYLISQLARLRDQYTVGRIIASIQASLWPGGVFFWYTPTGRAQQAAAAAWRAAQAAAQAAAQEGGGGDAAAAAAADAGGGHVRPAPMQPERFLEPGGPPPLDADEIREAVEAALLRRAPTTLVRLIGKNAYASGMRDLFDMLQSPAFCQQLGYGVLEIAVVHLFPELKPLFRTLQHGGLG